MNVTRIGEHEFHWGSRTYVMGIVNVTPDSFSGDGVTDLEQAVAQARQMEQDGADLIDIGGESTRPETWAGPGLSLDDELARVIPVVTRVAATVAIPISIDTYKAEVARRAVAAGAMGFVLKHSAVSELLFALHAALEGRTFITPALTADVLRAMERDPTGLADPVSAITPRQREILQLLAEGKSAKQIAAKLDISARTVEFHKYALMESVGAKNTAELIHFAIRHGIVAQ